MRFKPGVVMWRMHPAVEGAMDRIDEVHREVVGRDAIVTSARDGQHSPTSKHYTGEAVDLRTRDLDAVQKSELTGRLIAALGVAWDVVLEQTHLHVEYDPD